LRVDAVGQKSRGAQRRARMRKAERRTPHDALAGTSGQELEEVHLIGEHVDA
jgi:hypothetical protein